ncbi:MAG: NifB/NifX family molybdenum-iron cluster-binding protein [Methanobacteriaceae archaeon]|nr:NifB/NifX family molybdenum-iron cluster-binding protein [Methanobacteriaceae archaeon]MDP3623952.1 NifB/NifX family molybdenum-iron cluster-binding protein [Methanobacteriaceae archaeon]
MVNIPFKVAIASENGIFIDEHFGRAPHFLIYEVNENGSHKLIESRKNVPPEEYLENHDQALNKIINKVIDCSFVLAEKIGPDAKSKLSSKNIRGYEISNSVDDALEMLYSVIYDNYLSNFSKNHLKASIK